MADFDINKVNQSKDSRKFSGSGLSAGVESGLSMVEKVGRGSTEPNQHAHGANQIKRTTTESAGSKGGKNFTFME